MYEIADLGEIKSDCLEALGHVKGKGLETLEWAMRGHVIDRSIHPSIYIYIYMYICVYN